MVASGRFKKGTWTPEEDALLLAFVQEHGKGNWNTAHLLFPHLRRSGMSCRLRYLNQLCPGITPEEERVILAANSILGYQWCRIASMLPGRTDNTVENVVNMRLRRARRHAASVNFVRRAARNMLSEQQVYLSGIHGSPDTYNHISLPTFVLPPPQVIMEGTHGTWRCSATSPGRYTALVAGRGAPSERTHIDAVPTSSFHESFESFQLPSVQERLQSLEGAHQSSTTASSSESLLCDLPYPTSSLSDVSKHPGRQPHDELANMVLSSSTWSSMSDACP